MIETQPDDTQTVYDRHAVEFDHQRSRTLFEARWLTRFGDSLPKGGRVLDLGCGAGQPIAAWLIAEGFHLTAFIAEDPNCENHTVLMAVKSGD